MYSTGRLGQLAAAALAVLALSACAPMRVNSFAARGVNFTALHTYSWAHDTQETGDPRLDSNPFFFGKLQAEVEKQVAAKGIEKTDTDAALILHYHAGVTQKIDLSNADLNYSDACENCGPFVYDQGSLVLDFVDAKSQKLVWRGWAEGGIDGVVDRQDRMDEVIGLAVTKILAAFPAGS